MIINDYSWLLTIINDYSWILMIIHDYLSIKVVSVVLEWVNTHYTDFDLEPGMMEFLEQLEGRLEKLVS